MMAYNNELNERIHKIIARWKNTDYKKMFGGICYLLNGNMFCGIQAHGLILRLGPSGADQAL
jgi:TfoX/Sxy family transcriptional regulator of competence genes